MSKKPKKIKKNRSLKVEIRRKRWPTYGCEVRDGDIQEDIVSMLVSILYRYLFSVILPITSLDVMNDVFQSLTTCTLIIKQVLLKYNDSYIFNWHSKFANCLIWPKVNVLPYNDVSVHWHITFNFPSLPFTVEKRHRISAANVAPTFLLNFQNFLRILSEKSLQFCIKFPPPQKKVKNFSKVTSKFLSKQRILGAAVKTLFKNFSENFRKFLQSVSEICTKFFLNFHPISLRFFTIFPIFFYKFGKMSSTLPKFLRSHPSSECSQIIFELVRVLFESWRKFDFEYGNMKYEFHEWWQNFANSRRNNKFPSENWIYIQDGRENVYPTTKTLIENF